MLGEWRSAAMLAGVSTRRYATDGLEPGRQRGRGDQHTGTSKSAVSRRFVALTWARLTELMSHPVPTGICVVFINAIQNKAARPSAARGSTRPAPSTCSGSPRAPPGMPRAMPWARQGSRFTRRLPWAVHGLGSCRPPFGVQWNGDERRTVRSYLQVLSASEGACPPNRRM